MIRDAADTTGARPRRRGEGQGAHTRWGRPDAGSATVFTAAIALVLVMSATVAVMVVAVMLAGHRARGAADLAALAGASAAASGLDPCQAARTNASENRARVSACQVSGRIQSFVVTVTAAVDTGLGRPLPVEVKAVAHAGNVQGE